MQPHMDANHWQLSGIIAIFVACCAVAVLDLLLDTAVALTLNLSLFFSCFPRFSKKEGTKCCSRLAGESLDEHSFLS